MARSSIDAFPGPVAPGKALRYYQLGVAADGDCTLSNEVLIAFRIRSSAERGRSSAEMDGAGRRTFIGFFGGSQTPMRSVAKASCAPSQAKKTS